MGKDKLIWYVVYTKSRHEKKTAAYLNEKNIHNYLPTVKTVKQWSDRKKKVEEVLFRNYIFVQISNKDYYEVLNTPGVVRYVSIEGKAVRISDRQMETIKNTVEHNFDFDVSMERFAKGETVKIENGPLKGTNGEIVSFLGKKRLLIRINEIGYSLLVHVSPFDLKKTVL